MEYGERGTETPNSRKKMARQRLKTSVNLAGALTGCPLTCHYSLPTPDSSWSSQVTLQRRTEPPEVKGSEMIIQSSRN